MRLPTAAVIDPRLAPPVRTVPLRPVNIEPLPVRPLPGRVEAKTARQHAAAEMRRLNGWTKREARDFYDRLVHHDHLRRGRALVHALGMPGR